MLQIRIGTTFLVVGKAGLNIRERIFIAFAWLPKATVQAAIGPVALDTARQLGAGAADEKLGLSVLTIAVLSILITAPIGATFIMLGGPRLLTATKGDKEDELTNLESNNLPDETFKTTNYGGIENPVVNLQGEGGSNKED